MDLHFMIVAWCLNSFNHVDDRIECAPVLANCLYRVRGVLNRKRLKCSKGRFPILLVENRQKVQEILKEEIYEIPLWHKLTINDRRTPITHEMAHCILLLSHIAEHPIMQSYLIYNSVVWDGIQDGVLIQDLYDRSCRKGGICGFQ